MLKTLIVLAATILVAFIGTQNVFAGTPQQNYNVGYADGCQDGKTQSSTAFNGHSNANSHSQSYINGYNAGYNSCNNFNSVDLGQNGANQNSNNRNEAQSAGISQHQGLCVTVFSGCTQTAGNSQGLSN